jgi:hypothetical protein
VVQLRAFRPHLSTAKYRSRKSDPNRFSTSLTVPATRAARKIESTSLKPLPFPRRTVVACHRGSETSRERERARETGSSGWIELPNGKRASSVRRVSPHRPERVWSRPVSVTAPTIGRSSAVKHCRPPLSCNDRISPGRGHHGNRAHQERIV